jgi:hypothetical protein
MSSGMIFKEHNGVKTWLKVELAEEAGTTASNRRGSTVETLRCNQGR